MQWTQNKYLYLFVPVVGASVAYGDGGVEDGLDDCSV